MSDPKMIKAIKAAVTIPVMAKVRIGHFVEAQVNCCCFLCSISLFENYNFSEEFYVKSKKLWAYQNNSMSFFKQILEAIGVDYVDESEVLTPADNGNHIDKAKFRIPFVCGCRDLGEALRRVSEGAAMIRTKVVINSLHNQK